MKLTINYDHGSLDYPIEAVIRLPTGEYCIGSGRTKDEAKTAVMKRVFIKLMKLPPPEEIEFDPNQDLETPDDLSRTEAGSDYSDHTLFSKAADEHFAKFVKAPTTQLTEEQT